MSFTSESPPSLIVWIAVVVVVAQSLGTTTYSVESNLIMSDGETEKRYFQTYPSPLEPAEDGSTSVNVGSSRDLPPVGFVPEEPLSIQI